MTKGRDRGEVKAGRLEPDQWFGSIAGSTGVADCVREAVAADGERVILFVPVLLGVGIGGYFALPFEPPLAIATVLPLLPVAAAMLVRGGARLAFIALSVAAFGLLMAVLRTDIVAAPVLTGETGFVTLEAQVMGREALGGGQMQLLLGKAHISGLSPDETPVRIRLTHRAGGADAMPGDHVRLRARLSPPPDPVAPSGFDFARDAWFKRIGAVGYSVSPLVVTVRSGSDHIGLRLERLRNRIADRARARIGGSEGDIAAALLTGMRGGIREADSEAMRVAGLAHLLAISGLHIGLVTGAAYAALRLLIALLPPLALRIDSKRVAAMPALVTAFIYMLLAGATPPTMRAFLMIALTLFAIMIGRQAISLRLLAFAAILLLLISPEILVSASFQMSFAAVFFLIAAYERLSPWMAGLRRDAGPIRRIALYFLALILTTVIAELAILPLAAYHFNQVTSYGLLANIVAVPLMAIIAMPAGLAALMLMPFGADGPFLELMGLALGIILDTARSVSALPGAEFVVPSMPAAALSALVLGALLGLLWRQAILKLLAVPFLLAAILVLANARPPDLLIGRDGRLFGIVAEGRLHVSSLQRERYARTQWTRMVGSREAIRWDRPAGRRPPQAECAEGACLLTSRNGEGSIAVLFDDRMRDRACREAHVLIAAFAIDGPCGVPALVIDARDIARDGAQALWFEKRHIRLETARDRRGARPWVRQWTAPMNASSKGDQEGKLSPSLKTIVTSWPSD